MTSKPASNAERKRQARAKLLVEQQRAQKAASGEITPFRVEEQFWKDRTCQPDWSAAFSITSSRLTWNDEDVDSSRPSGPSGVWLDRHGTQWSVGRIQLSNGKYCCYFPDRPGLLLLPNFVDPLQQQELIAAALHETTGPASRTSLDSHYIPPTSGWWDAYVKAPSQLVPPKYVEPASTSTETAQDAREHRLDQRIRVDLAPTDETTMQKDKNVLKLDPEPSHTVRATPIRDLINRMRWTILGLEYHWGTKSYKWDKAPMPMPAAITAVCQRIASLMPWSESPLANDQTLNTLDWKTYRPEAGVVNFYQYKDSLTAHIDQSEVDSVRPLISVSLGESCIFLAGGQTRDIKPIPMLLSSGDVVIMAGDGRRVFHGVPRIIEDSCTVSHDWSAHPDGEAIAAFMRHTRMNVNVRQVFSESETQKG